MDNSRPFISIANHYHVQELLSALKRLDKPTILLWIIKSVFQNGYATDSWIVMCVPFLSSHNALKLYLEEKQVSSFQATYNETFMCLSLGLFLAQLTAAYTSPSFISLGQLQPIRLWYISCLIIVINYLLVFLAYYSALTALIPRLSSICGKSRGRFIFLFSSIIFIALAFSLIMFVTYKEIVEIQDPDDVLKPILNDYKPAYAYSFFTSLISLVLMTLVLKTSFSLIYRRSPEAIDHVLL